MRARFVLTRRGLVRDGALLGGAIAAGGPLLAITHIFPCKINTLWAVLKEVPFCTEPFGGRPLRVTFRAQT